MSDAPERIFAYSDLNDHFNPATDDWRSGFWDNETPIRKGVAYVRADLYEALQAQLAALQDEPEDDGWIPYEHGVTPIPEGRVFVRLSDGWESSRAFKPLAWGFSEIFTHYKPE